MGDLLKAELLETLAEFSRALPGRDVENIRELFSVGEYGVGLENLCAQIYEYDIRLSPTQFRKIASLGGRMKLDEGTWQILESLVTE